MGIISRIRAAGSLRDGYDAPVDPAPPMGRGGYVEAKLAEITADRAAGWAAVRTRDQALQLPVIMRARDQICGTVAQLPLKRTSRDGVDLGPGWLDRPDPNRTRGYFMSRIVDDMLFYAVALARITVRGSDDKPLAVEHIPYLEWVPWPDGTGLTWYRRGHDQAGLTNLYVGSAEVVELHWWDVIVFESPLTAILRATHALSLADRLDECALRFATTPMPAGILKQKAGDDLDDDEAAALLARFEMARAAHVTSYVGQDLDYDTPGTDPEKMQLVEARSYQDAALARVANVPNFAVGVGVKGDSMTYKTAVTARYDLIDFGIAPYLTAVEQTLSSDQVTSHGTVVTFDLEPFLRSDALAHVPGDAPTSPGGI